MQPAGMKPFVFDALQYCNWSRDIFEEMRAGGVDAVHVTVAYHEEFRELVSNLEAWNELFRQNADLIRRATSAGDVVAAQADGRTAILFGLQTPQPIADDLGLIEILHQLGLRFMQITYNNQSLLGAGHTEPEDSGLTQFGRKAIAEMNRVGMAIDLSHAGRRTAREAIDASARPVAITHANPLWWHDSTRNIPDETLQALVARGGILGFSLYPHHLRDGSACTLGQFCDMVAECADRYGVEHLGIGSDLCQGQPDSVVQWMREGRWTRADPDAPPARFPPQPVWFRSNRDFPGIAIALARKGFANSEVEAIMGGNWMRFIAEGFDPA